MTFKDAKNFQMQFGKYSGQTMGQIGSTDNGLLYLDYMRGQLEGTTHQLRRQHLAAMVAYLDDPTIASDLEALL